MVADREVDNVADMVADKASEKEKKDFHSVSVSEPSQSVETTLWLT